jgi:integrase
VSTFETRSNKAGETSYRVRFRHDGKHLVKTFTTKDKALAWKALLDATGPAKALSVLDSPAPKVRRTVADQVAHHIAHLTGISDGTRKRYTGYLDRRVTPDPLGALPLDLADRDAFAGWVNRLDAAGLSAKSIKNHHSVVSDAMRSAVRDGLVPANHAEGIRIETPDDDDADEMVTLDLDELRAFILATGEHWRPMVVFMFGTGVRWQEAAALKVKDVDLDRLQARVIRAWKDTAGQGHRLGKPKSKRSRRTIVFGPGVAAAIRPLVDGRDPEAFVFTNTRGGPVRYSNFWEDVWGKAVRQFAGDAPVKSRPTSGKGRSRVAWQPGPGKRPTPHDARHTYASMQIAQGKSMVFLQRQLGHESINTTVNTYTHLETRDLRVLSDVIEGALGLPEIEG